MIRYNTNRRRMLNYYSSTNEIRQPAVIRILDFFIYTYKLCFEGDLSQLKLLAASFALATAMLPGNSSQKWLFLQPEENTTNLMFNKISPSFGINIR